MNASNQAKRNSTGKTKAKRVSEQTKQTHAANGRMTTQPDYSSMKSAVDKIRNQVSFKELKDFYQMP